MRRDHDSPQARSTVEALERRTLLSSTAAGDEPTATPIIWQGQETHAMKGQWLARFDSVSGTPAEQLNAIRDRVAGAGLELNLVRHLGSDGLVLLQSPAELDFASLHGALGAIPGFRFAEPNFIDMKVTGGVEEGPVFPNDPLFGLKWSLHNTGQTVAGETGTPDADIDMPEAWDVITGGTGRSESGLPDHSRGRSEVVIGLIDSGVDYTHPDLAASIWQNLPELNGRPGVDDDRNGFVDDVHGYDFVGDGDPDPMDDQNHGTFVAGAIAASGNDGLGVPGINWGVKIMPLKVLNSLNSGTLADIVEGINYATMMRKRGVNIRLTNNSWGGGPFATAMRDAIAASADAGILFVASAGNNGRDTDVSPHYPSGFDLPNIIAVANTNNRDLKLPASNWGATSVDLGAPGRVILTTLRGGGYAFASGTSLAAPHVSGVASLAWGLRPGATYEQVRDAIFNGVDKIPALQGSTPTVTGGRLNAYNTLRLMLRGRSAKVMEGVPAGEPSADLTVSGVIGLAALTEQDRDIIH